MSSKILLLSGAVVTYQMSKTSYDKYMGSTNKDDIERYYNEANNYHLVSNYLTLAAVVVWIYGITDAYIGGTLRQERGTKQYCDKVGFIINKEYIKLELLKTF
jgi:hypothetical protein